MNNNLRRNLGGNGINRNYKNRKIFGNIKNNKNNKNNKGN
jgi:hypothetical protein